MTLRLALTTIIVYFGLLLVVLLPVALAIATGVNLWAVLLTTWAVYAGAALVVLGAVTLLALIERAPR